jgi:hypothetical protein
MKRKDAISSIENYQLSIYLTFGVQAIAEPVETIFYLTIPWVFALVIHFLYIFDCVKSKIDS